MLLAPKVVYSNFETVATNILKVADGETVFLGSIIFREEQQARAAPRPGGCPPRPSPCGLPSPPARSLAPAKHCAGEAHRDTPRATSSLPPPVLRGLHARQPPGLPRERPRERLRHIRKYTGAPPPPPRQPHPCHTGGKAAAPVPPALLFSPAPPCARAFPRRRRQNYTQMGLVDVSLIPGNRILPAKADPNAIPDNALGLPPFYVAVTQARGGLREKAGGRLCVPRGGATRRREDAGLTGGSRFSTSSHPPGVQFSPLYADIFIPGLKNHRSVPQRQWAIDRAIADRQTTWTGLSFVARAQKQPPDFPRAPPARRRAGERPRALTPPPADGPPRRSPWTSSARAASASRRSSTARRCGATPSRAPPTSRASSAPPSPGTRSSAAPSPPTRSSTSSSAARSSRATSTSPRGLRTRRTTRRCSR